MKFSLTLVVLAVLCFAVAEASIPLKEKMFPYRMGKFYRNIKSQRNLNCKIRSLHKEIEAKERKLSSLQDDLEVAKSELKVLDAQLFEKYDADKSRILELRQLIKEANQPDEALVNELSTLEKKRAFWFQRRGYEGTKKTIATLKTSIEQLQQSITLTKKSCTSSQEEKDKLKEEESADKERYEDLKAKHPLWMVTNKLTGTRTKELDERYKKFLYRRPHIIKDTKAKRKQTIEAKKKKEKLEQEIAQKHEENMKLRARIQILQQRLQRTARVVLPGQAN